MMYRQEYPHDKTHGAILAMKLKKGESDNHTSIRSLHCAKLIPNNKRFAKVFLKNPTLLIRKRLQGEKVMVKCKDFAYLYLKPLYLK